MNESILVVEDEMDIGRLLQMQLTNMGYQVDHVLSGEEALSLLNKKNYQAVILDWMLPGLSGIEISQLIRKIDTMKNVGILMLTAKSDPQDVVEGLNAGADDYMTKPFSADILKARMASLIRRLNRQTGGDNQKNTNYSQESDEVRVGPLRVSFKTYKAFLDNEPMNLTPSEFKLLTTMLDYRGRVLTRAKLIEEVQGEGITVIGRTIDTHVFGLRKKLGPHGDIIETVRGIGYRVKDDIS